MWSHGTPIRAFTFAQMPIPPPMKGPYCLEAQRGGVSCNEVNLSSRLTTAQQLIVGRVKP